jgi:uncharacterized protein
VNIPPRPLIILAKAPEPGQVKTRLIPALGADGASQLYRRLVQLTLDNTADWAGRRYLYCSPSAQHPFFTELARRNGLTLRDQAEGDLGARMAAALGDFPQGALLIGTDCPVLGTAHLLAADAALDHADTAIIPSEDGGYVLVGQRRPNPAPFDDMRWSHERVLQDTRLRLTDAGLSCWEGEPLWDLDEPEELARFESLGL